MDSSEVNPTWLLESPQMSIDENSQAIPVASQPMSEVLIKNLCNLTLNPSTKLSFILPECLPPPTGRLLGENIRYRRGVRTVLTDRRDKTEGLIQSIKKRYGKGVPWSDSQRERQQNDTETRSREQRFRCSCRFCRFRRDPSEDNYENYYNNKYYRYYYDRHRVEGAINLILVLFFLADLYNCKILDESRLFRIGWHVSQSCRWPGKVGNAKPDRKASVLSTQL
ncbi:developmental pluripotency-associated protein 3-like [Balaenoptera acutorostrata]|uniref:Developmental pluripotency-associated protein 3-like n=1 Tax=Balaenoptera acutorostrata TaxID=9767 RepID=A0ABM3UGS2_BALAC|nr:developmental pluripotency-associated protein 3-like [Balaenoptera acutorostrata]